MTNTADIYALLDSDGNPRYVGHSKDVSERLRVHWKHRIRTGRYNPAFSEWLCSLDSPPAYRVIARVAYADRCKWEAFYTARLRERFDLLNINTGAQPAHMARFMAASHSPETWAKMTATKRGARS